MEAAFATRTGPVRAVVARTALYVILADMEDDFLALRLVALKGLRLQQSDQLDAARTLLTTSFYRQVNDLRAKNQILTETLEAAAAPAVRGSLGGDRRGGADVDSDAGPRRGAEPGAGHLAELRPPSGPSAGCRAACGAWPTAT